MKNLIFGSGVVGKSTGQLLESNGEDVIYYDTDYTVVDKLKKDGKTATTILPSTWDICWMCTHEKYLPGIIPSRPSKDSIIIIRSTVEPSLFDAMDKNGMSDYVFHVPEFLREKNALEDSFFPDRVVIGCNISNQYVDTVVDLFSDMFTTKIVVVPLQISALIKLISNAWLSTQISFWNEIYDILVNYPEFMQIVPNIVTMDKRISKYGTIMVGKPYSGKCLVKDLDHLLNIHKNSKLLKSVKEVNDGRN
jgi:UDP-glucose 6-dehydrogenase